MRTPELEEFRGERISPGDSGYDDARMVFPGGFDRRPSAIFRPADSGEVARVIPLARESGLELAVRGGGHSGAGHGVTEGGIVLDVANLRDLEIDPDARTAWVGTGVRTGELTKGAWQHGLAVGFGDAGEVGIGGITLAGGIGFLVRKHGMTIDSLLAAEVVTAAGELIAADPESHPDLFWALRGGGGNFGVATRLKLQLHELPEVYGGELIVPADPQTVAGFVAAAQAAPEELSAIVNVMPAPPMPFIPEEHHGKLVVRASIAYAGPADDGERAVAPFRKLAEPIVDLVVPTTYPDLFQVLPEGYHPAADLRNLFADELGAAEAERIVSAMENRPSAMGVVQIRVLGGAMARVPSDETAFAHRDRTLMLNVGAIYMPGEEPGTGMAWVDELVSSLKGRSGAYAAFLGDEGPDRVREAYPGKTWDRLAEVKRRYDPENLFRLNQNVPPAAA